VGNCIRVSFNWLGVQGQRERVSFSTLLRAVRLLFLDSVLLPLHIHSPNRYLKVRMLHLGLIHQRLMKQMCFNYRGQ
jgi:hypothetical protein